MNKIIISEKLNINSNKTYLFYPLQNIKCLLQKDIAVWKERDYFYFYIHIHLYIELAINTSMSGFHEFYWNNNKNFDKSEALKFKKSKKEDGMKYFVDRFKYFSNKYNLSDKLAEELKSDWEYISSPRNNLMHGKAVFSGTDGNSMWEKKIFQKDFVIKYINNVNNLINKWNLIEKHLFKEYIDKDDSFPAIGYKNGNIDWFYKLETIKIKK